ncbi:NAD-dependent epimerase/dehydratase family protein [Actinacidiphila glaucinigra]|uniref:NAD-dependent epimerase/dehydratase family protein n=1 Tax=Actinacidiphila glaucinigra TaxID=235986 RepID=UPI002E32103D|nr:NAD-dependent epimerase/dehydratase family protein [Actinacidiphila glaucinigra]
MPVVVISGATGFIGAHTVTEAASRGVALRLMCRRPPPEPTGHITVQADLADPDSLRGTCDGADILIHCASHIGDSVKDNETVNARGTEALVREACRAGVTRVVYLSTASVYGRGTFQGARPQDLPRNPGSPTSASRACAEDAVLASGGIVLRPHLVYGSGDRWVAPGLVRIMRAVPATADAWASRLSLIAVSDLARLLVGAALAPRRNLTASVYHAAHPTPVAAGTLMRAVAVCAGLDWPGGVACAEQVRPSPGAADGLPPALAMLLTDHFFDAEPLWQDLRLPPGEDFATGFARVAPWYERAWAR